MKYCICKDQSQNRIFQPSENLYVEDFSGAHAEAVLGSAGPGVKITCGALFENILLTKSIFQVLLR